MEEESRKRMSESCETCRFCASDPYAWSYYCYHPKKNGEEIDLHGKCGLYEPDLYDD